MLRSPCPRTVSSHPHSSSSSKSSSVCVRATQTQQVPPTTHVSKNTEEEDAECLIPGVNASSSWHGGIQARLPKTKRGSSSMLCKWWYFFLFKESKNSKCNLCCHLKGPNKQVRELQKVSGLLKLNTNSSH